MRAREEEGAERRMPGQETKLRCGIRMKEKTVVIRRSDEGSCRWEGQLHLINEGTEPVAVVTKVRKVGRFHGVAYINQYKEIAPGEDRLHRILWSPGADLRNIANTEVHFFFYCQQFDEEEFVLSFEVPTELMEQETSSSTNMTTPVRTSAIPETDKNAHGKGDGPRPETPAGDDKDEGIEVEDEDILLAMKDVFLECAYACDPSADWFQNQSELRDLKEDYLLDRVEERVRKGASEEDGGRGEGRMGGGASPASPIMHPDDSAGWIQVEELDESDETLTEGSRREKFWAEPWAQVGWKIGLGFCIGFFVARKLARSSLN